MKEAIKDFLKFEKEVLSKPETFFSTFEKGFEAREDIIWKEYIDWQNNGGKIKDFKIKDIKVDNGTIITWKIADETFAVHLNYDAPCTVEEHKKGLIAVYSFMEDRPQYFKFRKMDSEYMFNPLRILLYKLIF